MRALKDILYDALNKDASDIHFTVGLPPIYRIDGELITPEGDAPLSDDDIANTVNVLANESQMKELQGLGESDFAVTFDNTIRMRCNAFYQQGHIALALRLLPLRVPTIADMELPDVIVEQAEKPRGLVLLTGPTGSGKSSTLAARNKSSSVQ